MTVRSDKRCSLAAIDVVGWLLFASGGVPSSTTRLFSPRHRSQRTRAPVRPSYLVSSDERVTGHTLVARCTDRWLARARSTSLSLIEPIAPEDQTHARNEAGLLCTTSNAVTPRCSLMRLSKGLAAGCGLRPAVIGRGVDDGE